MEMSHHPGLFMDCTPCSVSDFDFRGGGGGGDVVSLKELKQLLVCASLQLESARNAAKSQEQLHQARVKHLEELLRKAEVERDEATKGLQLLLNRVSLIPGIQSCLSEIGNDTALEQQGWLCDQSETNQLSVPLPQGHFNLHHHAEQKPQLTSRQHSFQSVQQEQSNQLQFCSRISSQEQFHLPPHSEQLHSRNMLRGSQQSSPPQARTLPCSKRTYPFDVAEHFAQNSSPPACFEKQPATASSVQEAFTPAPWVLSDRASVLVEESSKAATYSCFTDDNPTSQAESLPSSASGFSCASPTASAPEDPSALTSSPYQQAFKDGVGSGPTSCLEATLLPRHLPEPPEADPQVMLRSLPEKGKLLQAVMQAGPLLQTLLLAGPVPEWQHPPPAHDSLHALW